MSDKDKIAKLPKWAQEHIISLEREIKRLEENISLLSDSDDEPAFYVYDLLYPETKRYFSNHTYVHFPVSSTKIRSHISVNLDRQGHLYINSHGDDLIIRPHSSNAITLMMKDLSR